MTEAPKGGLLLFRCIQRRPFRYTRAWAYLFVAATFAPAALFAQHPTTTSLTLSASQVAARTAIQLTATVEAGSQPVSPGQVLFYDGKTLLGTAQLLSSGTASMKLRFGPGAHSLTASFAGAKAYAKSSSSAQSLTVTATLATSTSLSASGTNPYALTATVTSSGLPAPTGSVTFIDQTNNLALGSAALGAATAAQTFQAQISYGTGTGPWSVAVGDFNGDGIPDLAVANETSNTVSVLLGKGDSTFQAQTTYATGTGPWSVAVGDFNGDGIRDLVTANVGDSTVSVLLGKGDGTFQAQTTYATTLNPTSVAVGDFNGDGIPDLAVANYDYLNVLLGNGDGSFQAPVAYVAGFEQGSVAVGDFNGDGIPDLVTANTGDNTVSVLLGKGDGTFQAQTTYATGNGPNSVAVGDFNGDGIPDLAVGNINGNAVSVLLGKGDGTFEAQTTYGTGNWPRSVAVGDFNGDGLPDLAVANENDSTVSVLLNSMTQTASAELSSAQVVGTGTHSLQASYPGNTVYAASNGATSVQAAPLATTLTLSAPGTAMTGQTVQTVASLSPYVYSNLTTNGETVTFLDGSSVLGTAPLANDTATLSVTFSTAGSHVLRASYAGDTNFAAAASNSATVGVTQAATFTITSTPATETIKRGVLGGFILTLKSVSGFSGPVKLSCSGGPAGSYCLDLPQTVNLSANGTAYAVSGILFPRNSAPGTYIITFTGTSGTLTVTATAKFIVQETPITHAVPLPSSGWWNRGETEVSIEEWVTSNARWAATSALRMRSPDV